MGYRFPKTDRIHSAREFREVLRGGEKLSLGGVSLFVRQRSDQGRRLGLAVSRGVRGAVVRSRIKRWIREYFRLHRSKMPEGLDLILVAHRGIAETDAEIFRRVLGELFRRAGLLSGHPPDDGKGLA